MKETLKKQAKTGILYILVFFILIGIYMILMTLSSLIPSSALENNVRKSSEVLVKEGEKVVHNLGYKKETIFTFTDALMINTAYSIESTKPIESFLLARKNYIPGQTKEFYPDQQYNLGANKKYKDANGNLFQTKELYALMHGEKIEDSYEYARYWHGYLTILRPMLTFLSYSGIRIVFAILAVISTGLLLFLLYKKINLVATISFAVGLVAINIWVVTKSMNEFLIFLLAIIGSIILLLRYKKIKHIGIFFFIIGSIASFIDLLTAPIVTLGMVAIVYFLLYQKEEKDVSIKQYIMKMLEIGLAWCIGYGLTWASKWLITELIVGRPMLSQVLEQARFRTQIPIYKGDPVVSKWTVIKKNLYGLSLPVILGVVGIAIGMILGNTIMKYKAKVDFKKNMKRCMPYVATFFFPIIWILVMTQHSFIHAFFVYRIFIISIISLLLIIYKMFEREKEEK